MSAWNDFNDAEDQNLFDVIPAGTLVKVRLSIRPGGYNEPTMGWNDGYATRNDVTGAVYLNSEFVVLDGPYARRKVWTLIGLHSPKGPNWANMGRTLVRGILQSARGIRSDDRSPQAQKARQIQTFAELDGLEFIARVVVEPDQQGGEKKCHQGGSDAGAQAVWPTDGCCRQSGTGQYSAAATGSTASTG